MGHDRGKLPQNFTRQNSPFFKLRIFASNKSKNTGINYWWKFDKALIGLFLTKYLVAVPVKAEL